MRKLLITPAFDRKGQKTSRKVEPPSLIVFFKNRDAITVFNIKSGEEEDIPTSQVFEYKEYILIQGIKYDVVKRLIHD